MGYILLILLSPNFIYGYNVAHVSTSIFLFLKKPIVRHRLNYLSLVFYVYLLYIFSRLIIYFIFNVTEVNIDDLSEMKRLLILLLTFLISKEVNIKSSKLITITFSITLVLYIIEIDFYNGSHRYSSFLPSVNYIWIAVLFLVLKGKNIISKYDTIILSISGLLLSASLTSIIVSVVLLLIWYLVNQRLKITGLLIGGLILTTFSVFLLKTGIIDEFTYQSNKLTTAYNLFVSGDILQYNTFQNRLSIWNSTITHIKENPIFGHGVSKNLIRYTDNQYLLTLFRYGFTGMILELILILLMMIRSIRKNDMMAFLFLIGVIISGITANSLYEIKIIPIFGILAGQLFKYKGK